MKNLRLGVAALASITLGAAVLAQANWPDLTVLDHFPNPSGTSCSIDGKSTSPPEKKAANRLKNRFRLPASGFKVATIAQILAEKPGNNDPAVSAIDPRQMRAVSVTGFVSKLGPGGTSGESCNCDAKGSDQVDAHIEIVAGPNAVSSSGRGTVICEVTERGRRLAQLHLLKSVMGGSDPFDWSTSNLRAKLLGRWVRFDGWMFYDDDHHTGSWSADPQEHGGEQNWRGTCWEVHPVMGIEVLPGRPAELSPASFRRVQPLPRGGRTGRPLVR